MTSPRFLSALAIVVAGVLAYSSAFPGAFVFDDIPNLLESPYIDRPLSFLPGGPGYQEQPNRALTFLTFALDRTVAGADPSFHRGVNLAIHLVNALLVLALVLAAFHAPRIRNSALAPASWAVGLAAGLLFVTHPVQTQAVSYIVQRLASFASLLYLATAVLYVRWRNARDAGRSGLSTWGAYAGALLLALLATKTKEVSFTLPFALLLIEAVLFEGKWAPRLVGLGPFVATLAVIPLTTLGAAAPAGQLLSDVTDATRLQTTMPRGDYLLTEFVVLVRYLGLVAFPAGQSLDHDVTIRTTLADPAVLGAVSLLVAMGTGGFLLLRASSSRRERPLDPASRLAALGIAWFFLAISLESSVIPIVDPMFEHRVYLPFAGLSIALATLLALVCRRLMPARPAAATLAVATAVAGALGTVTWVRNHAWTSEVAIWSDTVQKSPAKSRPRLNLGVALDKVGRKAEALTMLEQAVAIGPGDPFAHESLGAVLAHVGRVAEGESHLRRAIELAPNHARAWYNLGLVRFEAYRHVEAVPCFEQALKLKRPYPLAVANLAASLNVLARSQEAVRLLQSASEEIQDNAIARAQFAIALTQTGDLAGAWREFEAVRRLSPAIAADLQSYFQARGVRSR